MSEVKVEQVDREAASALLGGAAPDGILEGRRDHMSLVQTLARHRIEAARALSAEVEALRAEASALRIGWWNDMRARGVTQDNAITTINTALLNKEPAR